MCFSGPLPGSGVETLAKAGLAGLRAVVHPRCSAVQAFLRSFAARTGIDERL
jgi:hypothetical protein